MKKLFNHLLAITTFIILMAGTFQHSPIFATEVENTGKRPTKPALQPATMPPFERALEIAKSRLSFYEVRKSLLEGISDEARVYQEKFCEDGNTFVTVNGGGLEAVMAILTDPSAAKKIALEKSVEANDALLISGPKSRRMF